MKSTVKRIHKSSNGAIPLILLMFEDVLSRQLQDVRLVRCVARCAEGRCAEGGVGKASGAGVVVQRGRLGQRQLPRLDSWPAADRLDGRVPAADARRRPRGDLQP